jgi:gliding motility-associated-like protein
MGGEITWRCEPSGAFIFTLKLYRDCSGVSAPTSVNIRVHNYAPNPSLSLAAPAVIAGGTDISPKGPGCPACTPNAPAGTVGAVAEWIYETAPTFLTGTPPAQGWVFTWDSCCRNGSIVNLVNPGSQGFTLRAIMYAYNASNTNPCYDSSPFFIERPSVIMCTRNPFTYNHNAVDRELDSLVYDWGQPMNSIGAGGFPGPLLAFAPGYAFNNPLPGPSFHPLNVPAVMNPNNGVVSFTSYTAGGFVTITRVRAYKCNKLVAEIYREIQIVLVGNCIISNVPLLYNTEPKVTAPFKDPATGLFTLYVDTVNAGDTVKFFMSATDFEFLPAGPPTFGAPQSITIEATGSQFGQGYTSTTTGCFRPPCATLNPPVPISAQFGAGVNFTWQTHCNHLPSNLGCISLLSTYNFIIRVMDNFCPAPAINFNTISITVLSPPLVPSPTIRCVSVNTDGSTTITWVPPPDVAPIDTNRYFHSYHLYSSPTGLPGTFVLLDSITNLNTTTYTHATANANIAPRYYFIQTRSGCNRYSAPSDTIRSIKLTVTNPLPGTAGLSWNAIHIPLPVTSNGWYHIYRELPAGSGVWTFIDSTQSLTYQNIVTICQDSINYRVQIRDNSGCWSISSIDGKTISAPAPVVKPPSFRCTAVQASGAVTITWVASADTGSYFKEYRIFHSLVAGGPYSQIATISNGLTTSYTHVGANGNAQINYYYIQTIAGCDAILLYNSVASDTLASILLTAVPSLGFATLNWNAIRTPNLVTSSGLYNIFREYPAGTWVQIASTPNRTYVDTIKWCNVPIRYRVEIGDASGCISVSSIPSGTFTYLGDIIASPSLRCIAVQGSGDVTLTWVLPPDPTNFFAAYQIYHSLNSGGPFSLIATVSTYGQTSYTHVGANANNVVNYYYMMSLSGCTGLVPSATPSRTLASIKLDAVPSLGFATLSWNTLAVPALVTSQPFYTIYREYPAGNWVSIGTSTTLSYVDTIKWCNVPIKYRVELGDASGCTSVSSVNSNVYTYLGDVIAAPSLRCVAVQSSGDVILTWVAPPDPTNFFAAYQIFHSLNSGGPFNLLATVSSYGQTSYTHVGANANNVINYYHLVSLSGCTGLVPSTLPSRTLASIKLNVAPSLGFANLSWNALAVPALVTSQAFYSIYREFPAGVWNMIGTSSTLSFVDTIKWCDVPISYRVEIGDASGCTSVSSVAADIFTYLGTIVDAPSIRCISVLPSGDIELNWVIPPDPENFFAAYQVYHSASPGGPFALIGTYNNYNLTNMIHAGANGHAAIGYYYVTTLSGCTGLVPSFSSSDTLASILVIATPTLGFANVSWNPIHSPNLPSSSGIYNVFREYPAGNWVMIGTTSSTTYVDVVDKCNIPINYRVEIGDASGCTSVSSVGGNVFTYIGTIVDPPSIRCVSVEPSGDVTLNWIVPPDPDVFFNLYQIFHSTNPAGPYNLLVSLPTYVTDTYTHIGANGQNVVNYYYIRTMSGCTGFASSTPSDSIASIKLTVTNVSGVANLNWNPIHVPDLPTSLGIYNVYKEYPAGSWNLLNTTTDLSLLDTITVCKYTINYRVEIGDQSGCTSISSVDGDLFQDLTPPAVPAIDSVSVDRVTGNVYLSWNANPSGDTQGYTIYKFNGVSWDSLATVTGINSTTWINMLSNANNAPETYAIAAFDSCGNISVLSLPHNTIHLIAKLDKCARAGVLNFNPYINMAGGVNLYHIYFTENGGPVTYAGSVGPATTTFIHKNLTAFSDYCYFIQAANPTAFLTSSSNESCIFADLLVDPLYNYLKVVTVPGKDKAYLESHLDTLADVSGYKILRSATLNGIFQQIAFIPAPANAVLSFSDPSVLTSMASHYYKIVVVDSCGIDKLVSNISRTIHLSTTALENLTNVLQWNDYFDWLGNVDYYNIYRKVDGYWESNPIATVPFGTSSYTDDVSEYYTSDAEFCYYIEAKEGVGNMYGFTETSLSNEACILQPAKLYTPNAFTPSGRNPVFYPVKIFIDVNSYTFRVFDRWGQNLFETHDPREGWNGKLKGEELPQGVYVYHVTFNGADGKEFKRRGTITLVK